MELQGKDWDEDRGLRRGATNRDGDAVPEGSGPSDGSDQQPGAAQLHVQSRQGGGGTEGKTVLRFQPGCGSERCSAIRCYRATGFAAGHGCHPGLATYFEGPTVRPQHHDVIRMWPGFVGEQGQQAGTQPVDVSGVGSLRPLSEAAQVPMFQDDLEPIGSHTNMGGMGSIQPSDGVDREGSDPAQRTHQEDQRCESQPTRDRGGRCWGPLSHLFIRHKSRPLIQPISPAPPTCRAP